MDESSESAASLHAASVAPRSARPLLVPRVNTGVHVDSNISRQDWNTVVMNAFAANHNVQSTLAYPWERGVVSAVFSDRLLPASLQLRLLQVLISESRRLIHLPCH